MIDPDGFPNPEELRLGISRGWKHNFVFDATSKLLCEDICFLIAGLSLSFRFMILKVTLP